MISLLVYLLPIDISLILITMETECNIRITSGHRDKEHNDKIGGAPKSFHLTDRARDVVVVKCDQKEWSKVACKYVSVIEYDHHVHIDNRVNKICLIGGN